MSDQFISFLHTVIEGKAKTESAIKLCRFSEDAHPLDSVWLYLVILSFFFFLFHLGLRSLRIY